MPGYDYSNYPIHRPNGPPATRKRRFPIWSIPPGYPTVMRVLIPQTVIVSVHYDRIEKRSVFCGGVDGACKMDHEKCPARWAGYLLCELKSHSHKTVIWHVTEGCGGTTPALTDNKTSLLNARITAARDGKTIRSPVVATVDHGFYGLAGGPRSFDLLAYLIDLYSAPNNDARRRAAEQKDDKLHPHS